MIAKELSFVEKRNFVSGIELFDTIAMTLPVEPLGAVRMTAGMVKRIKFRLYEPGDKRVERVIAYLQFKNMTGMVARSEMGPRLMYGGPIHVDALFLMSMPDSWSEKKKHKYNGKLHDVKPDIDNLAKSLFDAVNKVIWHDDKQVASSRFIKRYSSTPGIFLSVSAIREVTGDGTDA